ARFTSGVKLNDFTLGAPLDQVAHVLAPTDQCRLHLVSIRGAIVNAGDASTVAAVVIERRLDHVRVDLDVTHAGGDGPSEVAQLPRLHGAIEATIELFPAVSPRGVSAGRARPEQVIALAERVHRANDLERRRWQVDEMGVAVLAALLGQLPGPSIEVELARAHAADLFAPAAGEDQQANDAAEVVVTAGVRDRHELGVG